MRKVMITFLLGSSVFFASGVGHADPYSECMDKCGKEYSDCMADPQASEPEQQTAKEAACSEKSATCYYGCEKLKSAGGDTEGDTSTSESPQAGVQHDVISAANP